MTRSVFSELGLRKITQSCDTVEGADLNINNPYVVKDSGNFSSVDVH